MLERHHDTVCQFSQLQFLPPDEEEWAKDNPYSEKHRSDGVRRLDDQIPAIKEWLQDHSSLLLKDYAKGEAAKFRVQAGKFFVDKSRTLYRRNDFEDGQHKSC